MYPFIQSDMKWKIQGGGTKKLSSINEASSINASSEDVVNALRNLFNVNL